MAGAFGRQEYPIRVTFGLRVFWSAICAAVISGCGAHGNTPELPNLNSFTSPSPGTSSRTFHFTRTAQTFKVPPGVTQLTIDAYGARGGADKPHYYCYYAAAARGAAVEATIRVRPGQALMVYVGSEGIRGSGGKHGGGGWNGGGGSPTTPASHGGFGGGGSSDVRIRAGRLRDRIIVAAGGGGAGKDTLIYGYSHNSCFTGGAGGEGGLTGSNGGDGRFGGWGASGASQTAGGAGGRGGPENCYSYIPSCYTNYFPCHGDKGNKGTRLQGGWGAGSCAYGGNGGGGGGGYYGGGGGGGGGCCYDGFYAVSGAGGGGGGGSSFVEKSATGVQVIAGGGPPGDGVVTIRW